MNEAEAIFFAIKIWGAIGLLVSVAFLLIGIDRIDEDARGAYIFRPLLVPAILLIWPLVLWRWYILETDNDQWASRYRPPRVVHLAAALILAVGVIAFTLVGLSQRQVWPSGYEPVQLSEAEQ